MICLLHLLLDAYESVRDSYKEINDLSQSNSTLKKFIEEYPMENCELTIDISIVSRLVVCCLRVLAILARSENHPKSRALFFLCMITKFNSMFLRLYSHASIIVCYMAHIYVYIMLMLMLLFSFFFLDFSHFDPFQH